MNTANLQLEGLYLAIAAINKALVAKGILSHDEVNTALQTAEEAAISDERNEELSTSNRDSLAFGPRVLRIANNCPADALISFSDLARMVGRTKEPFNDQL